jgi:glucose-1-phosphate thymidylyltransferase
MLLVFCTRLPPIMKGLIPAAGLGTRLRPLTYTLPKPLLSVANKPIIQYAIEDLRNAGIEQVGIIVSDFVRAALEKEGLEVEGVEISYITQKEQLGIAHAVKQAAQWLAGDDFCLYLSDNLFEEGVSSYVRSFQQGDVDGVIALVQVSNPKEFGVAVLDSAGQVQKILEKPQNPPSNLAVAGVYCFRNKILGVIDNLSPSARGEYEITDAIGGLMKQGKVRGLEVQGWWKDTGRHDDLLDANRLLLERIEPVSKGQVENSRLVGRIRIESGAVVKNSTIIGPALIGAGAKLENVYVGPFTSIGESAVLKNVELEFSVIQDEAKLEDLPVRLQECLIGRKASVRGNAKVPRVHRLILSDASVVELG